MRESIQSPRVVVLGYSREFRVEQNFTYKSDHLVQCACRLVVSKNMYVTATLMKYQICVLNSS